MWMTEWALFNISISPSTIPGLDALCVRVSADFHSRGTQGFNDDKWIYCDITIVFVAVLTNFHSHLARRVLTEMA